MPQFNKLIYVIRQLKTLAHIEIYRKHLNKILFILNCMPVILLKRVYEKALITDGRRVLVERLWPRGIRRNTPNVDIWLKNVAPSNELRKWYAHDPKKWVKFKQKYEKELDENKTVETLIKIILSTNPVTLVYSTSDHKHNSAIVLKHYIEKLFKKVQRTM